MIYKVYTDQYVAAVIQGTFELGQWLISVPKERAAKLKIEPLSGQKSYPVILLEYEYQDRRIFMQDCTGETKKHLNSIPGLKLLCTYTITEDFLGDPKSPGEDYMGMLSHVHEEEDEA